MKKTDEKTFAWDGVQFPIPSDWDLATYRYRRHGADLVLEDTIEVRLELEWQVGIDDSGFDQGQQRYNKLSKSLESIAVRVTEPGDMPSNWSVRCYRMKDGRRLLTAFWTGLRDGGLAFIRFHPLFEQSESQVFSRFRHILQGFCWQSGEVLDWRVYDLELQVPRFFQLRRTSFMAGRKMMLFEHRFRRLFIWQFSLVSVMLKDRDVSDFIIDFIHRSKELPGVQVIKADRGKLIIRKKPIHIFGHYEDIGRLCFRYILEYRLDHVQDRLAMMVFHYRTEKDLNWLKEIHY